MKILIVEDSEERNVQFRKWLSQHDFDIATDADEGIKLLKSKQYDVIFLDHDLGNRSGVPSDDPNTGYAVAKEIPSSPNSNAQVIIHSMNPQGAANIMGVLQGKAFQRPFGPWIEEAAK